MAPVQIETERNRAIDAFRGLAIVGMIFFTVTLRLSSDLPYWLKHNVRSSFHAGDVVLPMFLFASGLSMAYYLGKMEGERKKKFWNVAARSGKLALVGISLSYFSAYGFLEMDEVMLSALCFLASAAMWRAGRMTILGVVFLIDISYIVLMRMDMLHIFKGHYLGGYPAAIFYLQVMLIGLIIGKGVISEGTRSKGNLYIMVTVLLFFVFFRVFIPVGKLAASPSFMLGSVVISFLVLAGIEKAGRIRYVSRELEYLGKRPLRHWVVMYVVFLIPLQLYAINYERSFPMHVPWPLGVAASVVLIGLLWGISRSVDRAVS